MLEKRGRGRPTQDKEEVRRKVLEAAGRVLLEAGFSKFSIDAVSQAAGVAKKTIYSFADSREELVGLIVASWTEQLDASSYGSAGAAGGGDAVGALKALLFRIYRIALSRDAVLLFRLISGEEKARALLAETYNRNGIEKGVKALSSWLQHRQASGEVKRDDPDRQARTILAVLVAEPLRQASIGVAIPFDDADEVVAEHVGNCVNYLAPLIFERTLPDMMGAARAEPLSPG